MMPAPIVDLVNWLKFPEWCSLCQHPESETIFDFVDIKGFHILFDIGELLIAFDKSLFCLSNLMHAELYTLSSNEVNTKHQK